MVSKSLLNVRNLALGFAVLFLSRINGLLYIMNSISDEDLVASSVRKLLINTVPFLVFFLFFVISLLLSPGFAADPATGIISVEKYKYLHNFIEMPVVSNYFPSRSHCAFCMALEQHFSKRASTGSGFQVQALFWLYFPFLLLQASTGHHFILHLTTCRALLQ